MGARLGAGSDRLAPYFDRYPLQQSCGGSSKAEGQRMSQCFLNDETEEDMILIESVEL